MWEGGLTHKRGIAAESRWGELLVAAQLGDRGAYRLLLESVMPFVHAIARKRSWSDDMAADVVQDVLLTVHRVRHTYEPGRPVKPWLAAITARRSIDAMRKRGRIRSVGGVAQGQRASCDQEDAARFLRWKAGMNASEVSPA